MAVINAQPSGTILAAYTDLIYLVSPTTALGVAVMIEATVTMTGTSGTKVVTVERTYRNGAGQYEFNVRRLCEDYFKDATESFNTMPLLGTVIAEELVVSVDVSFVDWYLDATTGLREENGSTTATATQIKVAKVTLPHPQTSMSPYYTPTAKFLTNRPFGRVAAGDTDYLTYYNGLGNLAVVFYDSGGNILGGATIGFTGSAPLSTSGVGAADFGAFPANTAYYTVTSPQFEEMKFWVKNCKGHRIFFINDYGCVEGFTFTHLFRQAQTKSKAFQKVLPSSPNEKDFGLGRTGIDYNVRFRLQEYELTFEEVVWLDELLKTPLAMFVDGGGRVPVKVLDGRTDLIDKDEGTYLFEIDFEFSVPRQTIKV